MAKDNVTVTALTIDGAVAEAAGVTITPANGASVAAEHTENLVLSVRHTTVSAKNLTIRKGVGERAVLGDLVVACTASTNYLLTLESARFVQADGAIYADFETGMTGKICAYRLPANV